jgi:hypothetical protein
MAEGAVIAVAEMKVTCPLKRELLTICVSFRFSGRSICSDRAMPFGDSGAQGLFSLPSPPREERVTPSSNVQLPWP